MATNLLDEQLVALRDIPVLLPPRRGKRVHVATIYRWAQRGIAGRRLETVKLGGIAYSSREALARFAAGPNTPSEAPLSAKRKAEIAAAEAACARAGI